MPMLTYKEAADRVGRSPRAIQRWRRNGMPMVWEIRDGQRARVVDEDVLLTWFRQRLANWPPHQFRLRRLFTENNPADDA